MKMNVIRFLESLASRGVCMSIVFVLLKEDYVLVYMGYLLLALETGMMDSVKLEQKEKEKVFGLGGFCILF